MNPTPAAMLDEAQERYRRGDLAGAETLARRLLPSHRATASHMLGVFAQARGRDDEALPHLRVAFALTPHDLEVRIALALAFANTGSLDEARLIASAASSPRLDRILAYIDQRQGRSDAAIAAYRRVLAAVPDDVQSWINLGRLLTASGVLGDAVDAFERSLEIGPQPAAYIGLSQALAGGARFEERRRTMRAAALAFRENPDLLVELGLAEAAMDDAPQSEAAYRAALAAGPWHRPALLELGMLLLRLNRLEDLSELVADARRAGIGGGEIDLLSAWLLVREGRFGEALSLAEQIQSVAPVRLSELIGEAAERHGNAERAFRAFQAMNAETGKGPAADYARRLDFPAAIERETARLTESWIGSWSAAAPPTSPPAPIFIVGFPRSGTTLLDTLLMNLPELLVLEEPPMMARLEAELGGLDRLAGLASDDLSALHALYFDEVTRLYGPHADRRVVDKFPLHLVRAPLIHRVFPDARFVFVERHPCDVVLSCFMARFQVNRANVHFNDLESAARLYDVALQAWSTAEARLPLDVHRLRYERMVEDPAGEMRRLVDRLGLPWRDEILDNRSRAAQRGPIPTPSYAQVAEPIYGRAVERWRRYRTQMEPVLPVLRPWVERLGYAL